jgi:hypothetical protein
VPGFDAAGGEKARSGPAHSRKFNQAGLTQGRHNTECCRLPPDVIRTAKAYWQRIRAGDALPRRCDLDPVEIPKLLPHVMLVDVLADPLDFAFRLIGSEIDAIISRCCHGRRFSTIQHMAPGNKVWADYETVVRTREPLTGAVDYVGADRHVRGVRHCLMPLSADGERVTMLFVAVEIERQ